MSNEFYTLYYIEEPGGKTGPHDAMSMVRKIRNGKLTEAMLVYVGDAYAAIPAGELPEFVVFFNPPDDAVDAPLPTLDGPLNIDEMLRDALAYFSENQLLSLAAAAMIVAQIILSLVMSVIFPLVLTAAIASVLGGLLLFLFLIYIAQNVAGQSVDAAFAQDLVKSRGLDLLGAAALGAGLPIGIPAMLMVYMQQLGLLLLMLGLCIFALFIFTPLFLMHDSALRFPQAMSMSRAWIMDQGTTNMLVIILLVAINGIATLLLLVPVFVTLPITFIALADLFVQRVKE